MKDLKTAILDSWLPSKWPRLVAGAALSLTGGTLSLSLWASKIGLTLTEPQISTIRTVGTPWLLLVALALIHYLVVREKNAYLPLQPWKIHEKIKLQIRDYYDVLNSEGNKVIRITLKEISKQQMPLPFSNIGSHSHEQIEAETATLSFDDIISFIPAQAVKTIPATMPFTETSFVFSQNANSEEANSVFSFSTLGHEHFFRCFVDHINSAKQEVEIDVYFLKMKKA